MVGDVPLPIPCQLPRCLALKFLTKRPRWTRLKLRPRQNGCDDGARRARVAEPHIAAAGVPVYGHFGDERNADASRDHSQEAAELAALERDALA